MEEIPPRGARALSDAELALLDGVVTGIVEARKGIAAFQALEASLLASAMALGVERADASRSDGDLAIREIAAEIAAALRVSDRTVQRRLAEAELLTTRFPASLRALTEGRISRAHLDVIADTGARLDDAHARAAFEVAALAYAEQESASRLKPVARLLAERAMPTTLAARHRAATAGRRIDVADLDDGMAQILAVLPAALAHGALNRLSCMATAIKDADPDDPRTYDQIRADLLADIALTGDPAGHDCDGTLSKIHAEVHITVPALALAGAVVAPAMIDGASPVDIDTARMLCAGAPGWERVITHPVTGAVLAVDRYRPSAELRRTLRARDQRCRFPGCRVVAAHCDIDHVHDHALGGETSHGNLAHVCRRHHVLKHHSAWTVTLSPDRTMTWRSPTGRLYPDTSSPPGVAFTAEGDPPPF